MKGHFSIEWLSQSSQNSEPARPPLPASTAASLGSHGPSTSGTVPENLPGFYGLCRPAHGQPLDHSTGNFAGPTHSHRHKDDRLSSQISTKDQETDLNTEEEETSGYESEGGQSLSPSAAKDALSVSPSTGRRPRTAFTAEQINSLEKVFKRNAYLGTQDKAELCKKLNLSDKQIRNWFQNRRMKLKRTVQDALAHACQAKVASQLMHYPELQTYRPAPYPSYYSPQDSPAAYMASASLPYHASMNGHLSGLPVDAFYPYNGMSSLGVGPVGSPRMVSYQAYTHPY